MILYNTMFSKTGICYIIVTIVILLIYTIDSSVFFHRTTLERFQRENLIWSNCNLFSFIFINNDSESDCPVICGQETTCVFFTDGDNGTLCLLDITNYDNAISMGDKSLSNTTEIYNKFCDSGITCGYKFTGNYGSYIKHKYWSAENYTFEFLFKTTSENGLLLFVYSVSLGDFIGISIQGKILIYTKFVSVSTLKEDYFYYIRLQI